MSEEKTVKELRDRERLKDEGKRTVKDVRLSKEQLEEQRTQEIDQAIIAQQEMKRALDTLIDEINEALTHENGLYGSMQTIGLFFDRCRNTQYIKNNEMKVEQMLSNIGDRIIDNLSTSILESYLVTIKSKFENTTPEFYRELLSSMFVKIIDIETRIPESFDCTELSENLLKKQLVHSTNLNEKLLIFIFYSGKIILQQSLICQFTELCCDVIISLLQTAIMFLRKCEAMELIQLFNGIKINEEINYQIPSEVEELQRDKLRIVETKIDIVTCMLSLELFDSIDAQLEHNLQYLIPAVYKKHLDCCCKYYRLTGEWLCLCIALAQEHRICNGQGIERTYKIEALSLACSLPYVNDTEQAGFLNLFNKYFTIDEFERRVLLLDQTKTFPDVTNINKLSGGIRAEVKGYLMSFCNDDSDQREYVNTYLDTTEVDLSLDPKEYLRMALEKLNMLAHKHRDYVSYAGMEITQLINNYMIIYLNAAESEVSIAPMLTDVIMIAEEEIKNQNEYERRTFFGIRVLKTILLNLVKQRYMENYCGKKLSVDFVNNRVTIVPIGKSAEQLHAANIVENKNSIIDVLLRRAQFEKNHEQNIHETITAQLDVIEQRRQQISRRIEEQAQEEERLERERAKEMEENKKRKNEQLSKKEFLEQRINWYSRECRQFIIEYAYSLGDDDLNEKLEDELEEMVENYKQFQSKYDDIEAPQSGVYAPEQWLGHLNDTTNEVSKERLEIRQENLKHDMEKIEARLYYIRERYQRKQMEAEIEEQENRINSMMENTTRKRYEHDLKEYQRNREMLDYYSGKVENIAELIERQDEEDNLTLRKREAEYNRLLVYKISTIAREARAAKKEEEQKEEQEKAEKLAYLARLRAKVRDEPPSEGGSAAPAGTVVRYDTVTEIDYDRYEKGVFMSEESRRRVEAAIAAGRFPPKAAAPQQEEPRPPSWQPAQRPSRNDADGDAKRSMKLQELKKQRDDDKGAEALTQREIDLYEADKWMPPQVRMKIEKAIEAGLYKPRELLGKKGGSASPDKQ